MVYPEEHSRKMCNTNINHVSKIEHLLAAYDKLDQFKLFLFDTGLLKSMAGIDNGAILLKADYQFKGPLTENYCLQQLQGQFEIKPRFFSGKSSELDFVLQYGTEIIPVEAKIFLCILSEKQRSFFEGKAM